MRTLMIHFPALANSVKLITITSFLVIQPWSRILAQHYVNKEWSHETGLPDELEWSASIMDALGNVIFVGNTLVAPANPDVLITKYDRGGNLLWQQTYAGDANAHDYGVAIAVDQLGTLYVAAATTTSSGALDVTLLKYQANGTLLWYQV